VRAEASLSGREWLKVTCLGGDPLENESEKKKGLQKEWVIGEKRKRNMEGLSSGAFI